MDTTTHGKFLKDICDDSLLFDIQWLESILHLFVSSGLYIIYEKNETDIADFLLEEKRFDQIIFDVHEFDCAELVRKHDAPIHTSTDEYIATVSNHYNRRTKRDFFAALLKERSKTSWQLKQALVQHHNHTLGSILEMWHDEVYRRLIHQS
jgi:hypothetical protein